MLMDFSITIELSDWAEWVAQDEDGKWWEYEKRPIIPKSNNPDSAVSKWEPKGPFHGTQRLSVPARRNQDWQDTLYKVIR